MRMSARVGVGIAAVLASALTACSSGTSAYTLSVTRGTTTLATFDLAALQALPQVHVSTPGTGNDGVQDGPAIRAVLDRAGAGAVTSVAVTGDEGTLTFPAADLATAVLDVTNRGTTKLAGADLPRERWVRNVTRLVVSP